METKPTINNQIRINDLATYMTGKKWQGYIWYINDNKPEIINNVTFKNNTFEQQQIQEAYLTNEKGNISVRIINSDGKELCFVYELTNFDKEHFKSEDVLYPSHIKGIDKLYFKQIYQLTESLSGDIFKTWQPIMQFFTGISFTHPS